jgi:DNA-directed RNA polymerase subunit beta'
VIVGRLIPAGTGFVHHQERRAKRAENVMQAADAEAALSAQLSEVNAESEAETPVEE